MNIHDGDLISTTEKDGSVVGVSGSSANVPSSSSISTYSSDVTDDASSSTSTSNGPFDDLSDLISQLPIIHVKKGLSKYYKGKSQSFTSLANATSLEDLVKRGSRIKSSCKRNYLYGPKSTISMKATRPSSRHSNARLTFKPFHDSAKSVQ